MTATTIPGAIEVPPSLRSYLGKWACAREQDRIAARRSSTPEELTQFYQAMLPEIDALVGQIGDRRVEELSSEQLPVFHLLLSFVEVSQMIEVFGAGGMGPDIYPEERFKCLM